MSREDIVRTIDDFVTAAKTAIEIGFAGVEIMAAMVTMHTAAAQKSEPSSHWSSAQRSYML
ncbi:12-oxophytodienoate reductase [Colletotrichum tofieldiae]|nr:12-oxophytodienoate reductase [Colletotrichum tofieldiae]